MKLFGSKSVPANFRPEHHSFGSVRFTLGNPPKALRLESIDGLEQGDTYITLVHLRNGRTVEVTWVSVDDMLRTLDELTERRYVRFAVHGYSYAALAPDAIDDLVSSASGLSVHLAGGQCLRLLNMDDTSFGAHIRNLTHDRAPAVDEGPSLAALAQAHIANRCSEEAVEPEAVVSVC